MSAAAAILIVDDRPEKVLALEAVLEDLGQEIVRAYSGRDALRQVLQREFAVILLDVNMPGMDGFETASLIRQRKSSEHVPIIFVTAMGDEMHAPTGYSLGAVDYILAPVNPAVLRTKVGVFVDLFRKTQQIKRQADWQRQRAAQLQRLAAAAVAINSAASVPQIQRTLADSAREVVGSHQSITLLFAAAAAASRPPGQTVAVGSFSDEYADWRDRDLQLDAIASTIVARSGNATRMSDDELRLHADWEVVSKVRIPPVRGGMLAAPLKGRDGTNLGVVYLSDRADRTAFTSDDEAVLVQLAQMGSVAIENVLFAQEREANRLKDEFLATLSHELRTPLNALLGWTQLLQMQPLEGEVARGMEVIERNVRAQVKLVDDLLDVSRITTGKLRLAKKVTDLAVVAEAALESIRPVAESRGVAVHGSVQPVEPVLGDADRLQQVVWNLLANAVKFTPAGGEVRLIVESDPAGGGCVVRVADTGRGIDPQFLPYVFDRFRQADSSSTRSHGGLGIGLTIVRHIVELHGGTVEAASAGAGHGATFTVRLPATSVAASGDADAAVPPPELADRPPVARSQRAEPSAAVLPEARRLEGRKIVIVEDEPDARALLAELLRRQGAKVLVAGSVLDGLNHFGAGPPDLLISDLAMPGEDGFSLISRVRGLPAASGGAVPAVAVSAYAREEDRRRSLAAGFDDHVSKPVDPAELIDIIARLAGSRDMAATSAAEPAIAAAP